MGRGDCDLDALLEPAPARGASAEPQRIRYQANALAYPKGGGVKQIEIRSERGKLQRVALYYGFIDGTYKTVGVGEGEPPPAVVGTRPTGKGTLVLQPDYEGLRTAHPRAVWWKDLDESLPLYVTESAV